MHAVANLGRAAAAVPATVVNACPSCWINWTCYWGGVALARPAGLDREIAAGGPALLVLAAGLAAFFLTVAYVQRQMSLPLLANTFGTPSKLVTGGVFRYTRNPIYAAFLMPLASLAYFSPLIAVGAMALYIAAMNVFLIWFEEARLENEFGEEFRAYKRAVPRWLF